MRRAVIPGSIKIKPGTIVLAPRVLERIGAGGTGGCGIAVRIVTVAGLDRAEVIGQCQHGTQGVDYKVSLALVVGPTKILIHAEAGEEVRGTTGGLFLNHVTPVIEIVCRGPADSLLDSSAEGVVLKAGVHRAGDGGQTIACIPGISPCAVVEQVAVGVIGDASAVPVGQLIARVIGGIGHRWRQVGAG